MSIVICYVNNIVLWCAAIKIADLGHAFAGFDVHKKWSARWEEELSLHTHTHTHTHTHVYISYTHKHTHTWQIYI